MSTTTLTTEQEQQLSELVGAMLGMAETVEGTKRVLRSRAIKKAREQYKSAIEMWHGNHELGSVPYMVQVYFDGVGPECPDPDGAAGLGRDRLTRGLRMVTLHGSLAAHLATILTKERIGEGGVEYVSLRAYVEAGLALEELGLLDPAFSVVEPGVESYYGRLIVNDEIVRVYDGKTVVGELKRIITRTLSSEVPHI